MFKYCTEILLSGKHGRIFYYFRLLNASLAPYSWRLFHSWLQAAQVKLHLWVSQLQSVYFCIWRKVDGFEGAGRFGAKQTARVSILKVNITLCLNYTPSALQFSHTLALSPLWVLFLLTPPLELAQLNTLLIPGLSNKSGRKSTSDKVSPPKPAALSWLLWLKYGACFWSNFLNHRFWGQEGFIQQIEYNYRKSHLIYPATFHHAKIKNSKLCLSE